VASSGHHAVSDEGGGAHAADALCAARGLPIAGAVGGRELAFSWCDGQHSLLNIADKLSSPAWNLYEIADTHEVP